MAVTAAAAAAMFVRKLTKHIQYTTAGHSPTRLLPTDRAERVGGWRLPLEKQKQRPPYNI